MSQPDPKTDAVRLLRELTEAHGVPGAEDAVRRIFLRELAGHGTVHTDRLGSAAVEREDSGPRVLVAGHFDEVGFAVQHITAKGFLKLVALGGWWTHTLVAQRVRILTKSGQEVLGVIGSTPPHFLGESAKDKVLPLEQLYVDVGAGSRTEVEALGISLGDAVAPDSAFTALAGGERFLAKAFDNRCGVEAAVQTMQLLKNESLPCQLIAAGSVQEEVGCRGAVTLAALTKPDVALVMEDDVVFHANFRAALDAGAASTMRAGSRPVRAALPIQPISGSDLRASDGSNSRTQAWVFCFPDCMAVLAGW